MTKARKTSARRAPAMSLLPFQRAFASDASRFAIALWSRQSGKGYASSFIATADALSAPNNNWIIAAPTERQAMETLEKCKAWARDFAAAIAAEGEEEIGGGSALAVIKAKVIVFANGSKIYALPGRPMSLRGFTGNLILDEFAFFENPEEVWKAIYPVITNPASGVKKIRITSTPAGKGNQFFKLVDENLLNPKPDRPVKWSVHKAAIHDVAREWEAAGMLHGKTAAQYVEEIRAGFDTPEAWPQEFECEFVDSDNFLLPYDIIALAESAGASQFADPALFDAPRPGLHLGIDFGRQNDPTVCWALERQGDVFWTREVLVLKGVSTPDQQDALARRIRAARLACFDYTGPGIGLGDYLARDAAIGIHDPARHHFGRLELCTFTTAFKRDIFPKLRRAFEPPVKLRVPVDNTIRDDLHAMRQIVNAGQYTYAAPRTAEGHSDRCTALALAVRAAALGGGPAYSATLC
ncbi:MAG: terminase family protein [Opitutaceae bacterium]|jgi:phage FluMu gp28-like protein|nr:terminase family protein [Opitutaceae bacterium]